MGIPTNQIDVTTCARDAASLAALGTYHKKLLAKQLGLNTNPDSFAAFVSAPPEQQAATLAAALASYDAQHGGAPPPAHVPVIAQPAVNAPPAPFMNVPPSPAPPAVAAGAPAPTAEAALPARRGSRRTPAPAPAQAAPAVVAPVAAPAPAQAAPVAGGVALQASDLLRIHARLEEVAKATERLTAMVDTLARVEGGQRTTMQMIRRATLANLLISERLGVEVDDLIKEALDTPPDFVDAFFTAAGAPTAGKAG